MHKIQISSKADVYSLGVIFCELITLKHPNAVNGAVHNFDYLKTYLEFESLDDLPDFNLLIP